MTPTLHIDFETRSVVDLKKSGVYVYAEHPLTSVTCAAYAFDEARTLHPLADFGQSTASVSAAVAGKVKLPLASVIVPMIDFLVGMPVSGTGIPAGDPSGQSRVSSPDHATGSHLRTDQPQTGAVPLNLHRTGRFHAPWIPGASH
mgnify:CR=1 FL=1